MIETIGIIGVGRGRVKGCWAGSLFSRKCMLSPTELSGEQQHCGEFYRWSFQQNMCAYSYPA